MVLVPAAAAGSTKIVAEEIEVKYRWEDRFFGELLSGE